mmetsp:Transcript_99675/g.279148  ORF Transcript_99675/g.279148 Transcript_99675/m.279148 type:complete len:255 (-) Transcript_99675:543-1307(-)
MLGCRIRRKILISFFKQSAAEELLPSLPSKSLHNLMATSELPINLAFLTSPKPPDVLGPTSKRRSVGFTTQCSARPLSMMFSRSPETKTVEEPSSAEASHALAPSALRGSEARRRRPRAQTPHANKAQMATAPRTAASTTSNCGTSSLTGAPTVVVVVVAVTLVIGIAPEVREAHRSHPARSKTRRMRADWFVGWSATDAGTSQHDGQAHVSRDATSTTHPSTSTDPDLSRIGVFTISTSTTASSSLMLTRQQS